MKEIVEAINGLRNQLIELEKSYQSSFLIKELGSSLNKYRSVKDILKYQPGPLLKTEFNFFLTTLTSIMDPFFSLQREAIDNFIGEQVLNGIKDAARRQNAPRLYPEAHRLERKILEKYRERQKINKRQYYRRSDSIFNLPMDEKVVLSIATLGFAIPFFSIGSLKKISPWIQYSRQSKRENRNLKNELKTLENLMTTNPEFLLHQSLYSFYRTLYNSYLLIIYPFYQQERNNKKKNKDTAAVHQQNTTKNPQPSPAKKELSDNTNFVNFPEKECGSSFSFNQRHTTVEEPQPSAPPIELLDNYSCEAVNMPEEEYASDYEEEVSCKNTKPQTMEVEKEETRVPSAPYPEEFLMEMAVEPQLPGMDVDVPITNSRQDMNIPPSSQATAYHFFQNANGTQIIQNSSTCDSGVRLSHSA